MKKIGLLLAIGGLICAPSAFATFTTGVALDGIQLNLNNSQNVSSFQGLVNTDVINITAVGNVDSASGNATITPTDANTTLSSLTFTPVDGDLFSGFSFRGQLDRLALETLVLTVQDNQGNPPQTFTFTGLGANADFDRIGIVSTDGETIKSVTLNSNFKQQKQSEFSYAGALIPEQIPDGGATVLLLGFALSGLAAIRRK